VRKVELGLRGLCDIGLQKRMIVGLILLFTVDLQRLLVYSAFGQMVFKVGDISDVVFLAMLASMYPLQNQL